MDELDKEILAMIGQKEFDRLERYRQNSRRVARAIDAKVPIEELNKLLKEVGFKKVKHSILEPKWLTEAEANGDKDD